MTVSFPRVDLRRPAMAAVIGVVFLLFGLFCMDVRHASAATLDQKAYRFYVNTDALNPTDPWPVGATDLGENTAITSADSPPASGDVIRIRMGVANTATTLSTGSTFKLQYGLIAGTCSGIASGDWSDVVAAGGGAIWRGYDNPSVGDGSTLGAFKLSGSNRLETYEEQNPSAGTPNPINNGDQGEWDWVVQDNGAATGATYCFRMLFNSGTLLNTYTVYPTVTTAASSFSFSISGLNAGTTVDGWTTSVTTTATTIPFSTLTPNVSKYAAQRLTVSENGASYQVSVLSDGALRTGTGQSISDIGGSNASPIAWSYNISFSTPSAFGYHSSDHALSGGSTRFQSSDTWAAIETTAREIVYTSGTATSETTDIVYRVEASPLQSAGSYSAQIIYVATPTF